MRRADIVRLADRNEALMDGTTGPVREILASADVVFAVWQDRGAADGVSTLLLKGESRLQEIAAKKDTCPFDLHDIRWSAVKVLDFEMALAARDTFTNGHNHTPSERN